jgi:hypothetical protein
VFEALAGLGLEPVLVAGMALVVLGSRRVMRDFDLLITRPGEALGPLVDVLYDRGFELASRVSAEGEGTATIGNRRVASARLRLDGAGSSQRLASGCAAIAQTATQGSRASGTIEGSLAGPRWFPSPSRTANPPRSFSGPSSGRGKISGQEDPDGGIGECRLLANRPGGRVNRRDQPLCE